MRDREDRPGGLAAWLLPELKKVRAGGRPTDHLPWTASSGHDS